MNIPASTTTPRFGGRRLDWVALTLIIVALILGIFIAIAVKQIGVLSLLAIPALLLFISMVARPDIGLASFIFVTYTQLSNVGIVYYGLPSIAQPLAALLLLLIILRITLYGDQPLGWLRAGPILLIYVSVWLVSLLHAANFSAALTAFIGFIKDALGCVIVIFLIQQPKSYRTALWALIITGIFIGTITAYQGLTNSFDSEFWGFGQLTAQISGDVSTQRTSGPYSNPNAYAQILVVILPLALDRLWQEHKPILRALAAWSAIVVIISILYTYSRNGLLSMLFAVGLLIAQRRTGFMPWIVTIALGLGLFQFLPPTYTERISTLFQFTSSSGQITDSSFVGRLSENTAAWKMFLDHPILGVGLGNFRVYYQDYSRAIGLDPRRTPRSPANLYLELLSEQGLIGTTVFFALMYIVFKGLRSASNQFGKAGLHNEAHMTTALLSGFAGYLFAAINKNSAYANVFWVLMGIMLAVAQAAQISLDEKTSNAPLTTRNVDDKHS